MGWYSHHLTRYNIWLLCFKKKEKKKVCFLRLKSQHTQQMPFGVFTGVSLFRSWGSLGGQK